MRHLPAVLALFALTVASCTGADGGAFEGVTWQLETLVGPDGTSVPSAPGVTTTARFEDGEVSGTGGCNTYGAEYAVDGDQLTIGPTMSTLIGCQEPVATQESAFFAALGMTASYEASEDSFVLRAANGAELARFGLGSTLTGSAWQATGINNGVGGVESLIQGSSVTATFDGEGQVSGSSGCNSYSGEYEVDRDTLSIGPVGGTEMACTEPAGVMEQEQRYLAALGRVATWAIEGTNLVLRDADGATLVAYAPVPPGGP